MKKIALDFLRRGLVACGFGPVVLAVVYLIFASTGCGANAGSYGSMHGDIFVIRIGFCCRRHECDLSNRTASRNAGNFDSRHCVLCQLFDCVFGERLAQKWIHSDFGFFRYFCCRLYLDLGNNLFCK